MCILFSGHIYRQTNKIIWICSCISTDGRENVVHILGCTRMITVLDQLRWRVNLVTATIVIEPCHRLSIRRETEISDFQWIRIFVFDDCGKCVFDVNTNISGCRQIEQFLYDFLHIQQSASRKQSVKPVVISISAFNGQLLLRISSVYANSSPSSPLLRDNVVRLFSHPP